MTKNEDQSEITRLRDEVSQLRQGQGSRQVVTITRIRIGSVVGMIAVATFFVFKMIDGQVPPRNSLTILMDVLLPLSLLLVFGVLLLCFYVTYGPNPNEKWIDRFLKKSSDGDAEHG
jgi:hypothetical protein